MSLFRCCGRCRSPYSDCAHKACKCCTEKRCACHGTNTDAELIPFKGVD